MQLGLDHEHAMYFWLWAARLWPVLFPLTLVLVLRTKIAKPFTFFILGVLVCYGVQFIVGQISPNWPTGVPTEAPFPEQFFQVLLSNMFRTILISLVLSVAPLWWLYRLLRWEQVKK